MEGILVSFLALLLACLILMTHDGPLLFSSCREKQTVDLIVWVGCKVYDRRVPEAGEALRLKTIDDARRIRKSVGPPI
jgi:hypothetical protein